MRPDHARLEALSEWATTFLDACATDDIRLGIRSSLARVTMDHPEAMATALAGIASDLALTLPTNDPWRRTHPDAFGAVDDHIDLIPEFGDGDPTGPDWQLVAVRGGISPRAVSIVLGAFEPRALTDHLTEMLTADPDGAISDCGDAIRWLTFRRRALTGNYVDVWILQSAAHWVQRDMATPDEAAILDCIHREDVERHRIDDGLYDPEARLAADFADFTAEEVERYVKR